jgi:hypothetical protein
MLRADYATPLYPQKFALSWLTSDGRSVDIVRSRTKATELLLAFSSYFEFQAWTKSKNAVILSFI